MRLCQARAVLLVPLLLCVTPVRAQEWTRFRGPNGTGVSDAKSIPATWTEADYRWKIKLPGKGHGSPVVWGDKLFVLSADPHQRDAICDLRPHRFGRDSVAARLCRGHASAQWPQQLRHQYAGRGRKATVRGLGQRRPTALASIRSRRPGSLAAGSGKIRLRTRVRQFTDRVRGPGDSGQFAAS